MRIRKMLKMSLFAIVVFAIGFVFASPAPAGDRVYDVKVMTRNMDAGTDFTLVAFAQTTGEFIAGVGATIDEVVKSNIPARAARLAAEIAETKPDVIALQEVTTWKIGRGRYAVELDQLELLMNALRAARQHYEVVGIQTLTHIDIQIPQVTPVSFTDHNATLVRSGQPDVLRTEAHKYEEYMVFQTPVGDIPIWNGWMTADFKIRDSRFKLVNTHLASSTGTEETKQLQVNQTNELLGKLGHSDLPIILAGDFNSDAESTQYYYPDATLSAGNIVNAGFTDVWHELHKNDNDPGYSWPLFAEDNMEQYYPFMPLERIDLIFSNWLEADSIEMTGLIPGMYASDHAGVVAVFDLMKYHPRKHR
jgi:endonuclease/exonuclease/phosphatase family metal-dependent hydrolase